MPRVKFTDTASNDGSKIGVYSFGDKVGGGPAAQFEFDVTKLRDPAGQKQFSGMNGTNPAVRAWVSADKRVEAILNQCLILADDLIKPKQRETSGVIRYDPVSTWLSFAFRDYHGKWASPAIAELVADALDKEGYQVYVIHHSLKALGEKE